MCIIYLNRRGEMLNNQKKIILLIVILIAMSIIGCNGKETEEVGSLHLEDEIVHLKNINSQLTEEKGKMTSQNNELQESLRLANEKVTNQQGDIRKLNKELNSKQFEMFPPSLTFGYLGYNPDFYVLVQNEIFIKMLPYDNAQNINIAFEKSLVRVLDKAQFQSDKEIANDRYWYYVEVTVYDTPLNTRGWIRVEETVPYTKENQHLVKSPISIKDGSKIYENSNPVDNKNAEFTLSEYEGGMIEEHRDGYVRVMSIGGRDFWTKYENVIYPEIKPFKN